MRFAIPWVVAATLSGSGCTADNPDYRPAADGATDSAVAAFQPSHLTFDWLTRGTGPITATQSIDTDALTIDGHPPGPGVTFVVVQEAGLAVLAVASFAVPSLAVVRVRGSNPLAVVSGSTIDISGTIDGSARGGEPGPGGSPPDTGPGAGRKGAGSPLNSGGSGAGYGDRGGHAGGVSGNCQAPATAANPGSSGYGDTALGHLVGGSGGGTGSIGLAGCPLGTNCRGGAGGGAIQLSAADSISVSGVVNAGGGGGKGGCKNPLQIQSGSGGGGGSGGSVLIEAPSMTLSGMVAANGGAGGGGAFYTAGGLGSDGQPSATPAPGGTGGQDAPFGGGEVVAARGGAGGTSGAGGDSQNVTNCGNSGGGGGAPGRIYLRARDPLTAGGHVSPLPTLGKL